MDLRPPKGRGSVHRLFIEQPEMGLEKGKVATLANVPGEKLGSRTTFQKNQLAKGWPKTPRKKIFG